MSPVCHKVNTYRRTNTFTLIFTPTSNLETMVHKTCMSLDCGSEPEILEETCGLLAPPSPCNSTDIVSCLITKYVLKHIDWKGTSVLKVCSLCIMGIFSLCNLISLKTDANSYSLPFFFLQSLMPIKSNSWNSSHIDVTVCMYVCINLISSSTSACAGNARN